MTTTQTEQSTISDRFADFIVTYVPRPLHDEAGDVLVKLLLDMRREGGDVLVGKWEASREH